MSSLSSSNEINAVHDLLDRMPNLDASLYEPDVLGRDTVEQLLLIASIGSTAVNNPRFLFGNNPSLRKFGEVILDDSFMHGIQEKTVELAGHYDVESGSRQSLRYLDTVPYDGVNQIVGYNRTALFIYAVRTTDIEAETIAFWQGYSEQDRRAAPWFTRLSLLSHEEYRRVFDGNSKFLNKSSSSVSSANLEDPPLDVPLLRTDIFRNTYDAFKESDIDNNSPRKVFEEGDSKDMLKKLSADIRLRLQDEEGLLDEQTKSELLTEIQEPIVAREDTRCSTVKTEPLVLIKSKVIDHIRSVFKDEFIDVTYDEATGLKVDLLQYGSNNYLFQHIKSTAPGYSWIQLDLFAGLTSYRQLKEALSTNPQIFVKKVVRS
jgi:hypothetical protein